MEKVLNRVIGLLIFNTGRTRGINNSGEKELLNTSERKRKGETSRYRR